MDTALTPLVSAMEEITLVACNNAVNLRKANKLDTKLKSPTLEGSIVKDLVTEADRTNEDKIRERLVPLVKDVQFLGEEGNKDGSWKKWADSGAAGKWLVVDPIDGTSNFGQGIGRWAVSIGLQEDGVTTAATVYVADDKEGRKGKLYSAIEGMGAYVQTVNDKGELEGSKRKLQRIERGSDGKGAMLIGSFPEDYPDGTFNGKVPQPGAVYDAVSGTMKEQTGNEPTLITCACADMLSVMEGKARAYAHGVHYPWDTAAASLILSEAGYPVREFANAGDFGKSTLITTDSPALLKALEHSYRSAGASCLPTLNDQSMSATPAGVAQRR